MSGTSGRSRRSVAAAAWTCTHYAGSGAQRWPAWRVSMRSHHLFDAPIAADVDDRARCRLGKRQLAAAPTRWALNSTPNCAGFVQCRPGQRAPSTALSLRCLTRRGSGVRIPQRPRERQTLSETQRAPAARSKSSWACAVLSSRPRWSSRPRAACLGAVSISTKAPRGLRDPLSKSLAVSLRAIAVTSPSPVVCPEWMARKPPRRAQAADTTTSCWASPSSTCRRLRSRRLGMVCPRP